MASYLDGTGLGHLIEKIKNTFIKKTDTVAASTLAIDSAPTANSTNLVTSGGVKTALDGKLATLSTLTAYTSKGSATKVPLITTNTLGLVTGITEVTITLPAAPGTLNTNNATALSVSSSEALSGTVKLHKISKTGSYNDLLNTPTIPSAPGTLNTTATTAQSTNASEALSGSVTLHKVSKTGSYNDLLNKPTIPAALIQSDWNLSTTTSLDYIKNKPDIYSLVTTTVPNVTSAGTASTWSFALGTGDNAHTLMINGNNSTAPTLGDAKTVATGALQSSNYGLYGKPAGGSTR